MLKSRIGVILYYCGLLYLFVRFQDEESSRFLSGTSWGNEYPKIEDVNVSQTSPAIFLGNSLLTGQPESANEKKKLHGNGLFPNTTCFEPLQTLFRVELSIPTLPLPDTIIITCTGRFHFRGTAGKTMSRFCRYFLLRPRRDEIASNLVPLTDIIWKVSKSLASLALAIVYSFFLLLTTMRKLLKLSRKKTKPVLRVDSSTGSLSFSSPKIFTKPLETLFVLATLFGSGLSFSSTPTSRSSTALSTNETNSPSSVLLFLPSSLIFSDSGPSLRSQFSSTLSLTSSVISETLQSAEQSLIHSITSSPPKITLLSLSSTQSPPVSQLPSASLSTSLLRSSSFIPFSTPSPTPPSPTLTLSPLLSSALSSYVPSPSASSSYSLSPSLTSLSLTRSPLLSSSQTSSQAPSLPLQSPSLSPFSSSPQSRSPSSSPLSSQLPFPSPLQSPSSSPLPSPSSPPSPSLPPPLPSSPSPSPLSLSSPPASSFPLLLPLPSPSPSPSSFPSLSQSPSSYAFPSLSQLLFLSSSPSPSPSSSQNTSLTPFLFPSLSKAPSTSFPLSAPSSLPFSSPPSSKPLHSSLSLTSDTISRHLLSSTSSSKLSLSLSSRFLSLSKYVVMNSSATLTLKSKHSSLPHAIRPTGSVMFSVSQLVSGSIMSQTANRTSVLTESTVMSSRSVWLSEAFISSSPLRSNTLQEQRLTVSSVSQMVASNLTSRTADLILLLTTSRQVESASSTVLATNIPTQPSAPSDTRIIDVTVSLINEEYDKDLLNESSARFVNLSQRVNHTLWETFSNDVTGLKEIELLRFRNGSVLVDFRLLIDSTSNTTIRRVNETLLGKNGSNTQGFIFGKILVTEKCSAGFCANAGSCDDSANGPVCRCGNGFLGYRCSQRGEPVHGNYSEWSEFTDCTKTCGGGQKHRRRTCSNPSPRLGGNDCAGLGQDVEYINCNSDVRCPVSTEVWIAVGVACGVFLLILFFVVMLLLRRRRKQVEQRNGKSTSGEYESNGHSTVVPLEVIYEDRTVPNASPKGNQNPEFIGDDDDDNDIYKAQLLLFLKHSHLIRSNLYPECQDNKSDASEHSKTNSRKQSAISTASGKVQEDEDELADDMELNHASKSDNQLSAPQRERSPPTTVL